jgi:ribosomal protein S21
MTAGCSVRGMDAAEQAYRAFQRKVDRVCTLILFERPEDEIERARIELQSEAHRLFPDKARLYEIVYESRFRRLWNQFRA